MDPQRIIDLAHQLRRDSSKNRPNPLHLHASNLLRVGLGIGRETARFRIKKDLKRVDPLDVRSNRYDGDDPPAQATRRRVGGVVAYENRRSPF